MTHKNKGLQRVSKWDEKPMTEQRYEILREIAGLEADPNDITYLRQYMGVDGNYEEAQRFYSTDSD